MIPKLFIMMKALGQFLQQRCGFVSHDSIVKVFRKFLQLLSLKLVLVLLAAFRSSAKLVLLTVGIRKEIAHKCAYVPPDIRAVGRLLQGQLEST